MPTVFNLKTLSSLKWRRVGGNVYVPSINPLIWVIDRAVRNWILRLKAQLSILYLASDSVCLLRNSVILRTAPSIFLSPKITVWRSQIVFDYLHSFTVWLLFEYLTLGCLIKATLTGLSVQPFPHQPASPAFVSYSCQKYTLSLPQRIPNVCQYRECVYTDDCWGKYILTDIWIECVICLFQALPLHLVGVYCPCPFLHHHSLKERGRKPQSLSHDTTKALACSQNAGTYIWAKLDLYCAFIYLFCFQKLISLLWPTSFMLDLAFQFCTHLALSWSQMSVCLQWEFQLTRAQPLLCMTEGCMRMGEEERSGGREARTLSKMKNDNELSLWGERVLVLIAAQLWQMNWTT